MKIRELLESEDFEFPTPEKAQKTQIPGTAPTYAKAKAHLDTHSPEGKILDFGAGLGHSSHILGADTYEPFPKGEFVPTYNDASDIPSESYEKVTNFNVLNVVPPKIRHEIVKNIGRILKPGGVGLITTRGKDVMDAKGKPGPEPMSVITSTGTYQKGFTTSELLSYVQDILGSDFKVTPLKLSKAGVMIKKKS